MSKKYLTYRIVMDFLLLAGIGLCFALNVNVGRIMVTMNKSANFYRESNHVLTQTDLEMLRKDIESLKKALPRP